MSASARNYALGEELTFSEALTYLEGDRRRRRVRDAEGYLYLLESAGRLAHATQPTFHVDATPGLPPFRVACSFIAPTELRELEEQLQETRERLKEFMLEDEGPLSEEELCLARFCGRKVRRKSGTEVPWRSPVATSEPLFLAPRETIAREWSFVEAFREATKRWPAADVATCGKYSMSIELHELRLYEGAAVFWEGVVGDHSALLELMARIPTECLHGTWVESL